MSPTAPGGCLPIPFPEGEDQDRTWRERCVTFESLEWSSKREALRGMRATRRLSSCAHHHELLIYLLGWKSNALATFPVPAAASPPSLSPETRGHKEGHRHVLWAPTQPRQSSKTEKGSGYQVPPEATDVSWESQFSFRVRTTVVWSCCNRWPTMHSIVYGQHKFDWMNLQNN